MRKTKIICTLGPATDAVLPEMIKAGMNVARMNFSHGSHEEHKARMDAVKAARAALGMPVGIMLDTKGPEIRTKTYQDGKIEIVEGQEFTLTTQMCIRDRPCCAPFWSSTTTIRNRLATIITIERAICAVVMAFIPPLFYRAVPRVLLAYMVLYLSLIHIFGNSSSSVVITSLSPLTSGKWYCPCPLP